MKKLLLLAAISIMSLSAVPISFTSLGFASGAFNVTGNANVPTVLTFSNPIIGGLLNCSGPSAILCAPNGLGVVSVNNLVFDSGGAPTVFQLGLGLTYTTDSTWVSTGSLSTGFTLFTIGKYCSVVLGFTCTTGSLNGSLQPPSDGTSLFGAYNGSWSGKTDLPEAPEPASVGLIGSGLAALGMWHRRRSSVSK